MTFLSTFEILVKFDIFVKFDILINCWYLCQLLIVLSTFWSKYQLVVPLNCNFADIWIFGYLEHYLARSAYESLDIWNIIWLEVRVMSVWDFDFESGANIFWCLSDWDFNSRIISSSHLLTRRINWVRDDFTKIPKRGRPLCPGHWACQWEIKFMHRWHLALFKQAFGAPY